MGYLSRIAFIVVAWVVGCFVYMAEMVAPFYDGALSLLFQPIVAAACSTVIVAAGLILGLVLRVPVLGRAWRSDRRWAGSIVCASLLVLCLGSSLGWTNTVVEAEGEPVTIVRPEVALISCFALLFAIVNWPLRSQAVGDAARDTSPVQEILGMPEYERQLVLLPKEVSFGISTIQIAPPDQLRDFQLGYAVEEHGNSLTVDAEGDWKSVWVVIGQDDTRGDPIFIDASEKGFPVYTAMHGEGDWSPTRIASWMEGFRQALEALSKVVQGREHPVALEANPLAAKERDAVLARILEQNPDADLDYWAALRDAS